MGVGEDRGPVDLAVGPADDQVSARLLAAAAQVQQNVLGQRGDPVGVRGAPDERENGVHVVRREPPRLLDHHAVGVGLLLDHGPDPSPTGCRIVRTARP